MQRFPHKIDLIFVCLFPVVHTRNPLKFVVTNEWKETARDKVDVICLY